MVGENTRTDDTAMSVMSVMVYSAPRQVVEGTLYSAEECMLAVSIE